MAAVKKAFNNPIVIGVLVLLAIAFVFRDFIHFSSTSGTKHPSLTTQTVSQPPSKTPTDTALAQAKTKPSLKHAVSTLKHTDWDRLAKIPLSEKDPFSPESMSLPRQAEADMNASLNPDQGGMPAMKLSAIVTSENIHYATINGRLLTTGEVIDGWKLVAIGVNRVQLRGNEGLLTLDINGDMRMGGKVLQPIKRKTLSLFDSLKKNGIVPELPRTRTK